MASKYIPLRPKGKKFNLTKEEQDCLTWFVLSNTTQDDAFARFVHPDLFASPRALSQYARQFFASVDAKEYIRWYEATLEADREDGEETKDKDKKKQKAVEDFTDKVFDSMSSADSIDDMDTVAKLADRIGVFSDEKAEVISPRRYLPVRCLSECQYRLFVEQGIKNGEIENECTYCKALAYATERGYKYDPTTNLSMPQGDAEQDE